MTSRRKTAEFDAACRDQAAMRKAGRAAKDRPTNTLPFDPNARDAVTMRSERVRIIARQFGCYAGLMRSFANCGGDVDTLRKFAAQAADCLDAARGELFAVINDATINPPAPPPVQPKE